MASIERTAYPRFPRKFDIETVRREFSVTNEERTWIKNGPRSAGTRLGLGLMLKSFQFLHHFPEPEEIPPEVYEHVRTCLGLGESIVPVFGERSARQDNRRKILEFTGKKGFYAKKSESKADPTAMTLVDQYAEKAAEVMDRTTDIINSVIDDLVNADYELPAFSALDNAAERAHNNVERRVISELYKRMTSELRDKVSGLLSVGLDRHVSMFNNLKHSAGKASRKHLEDMVIHLDWLSTFGNLEPYFDGIAETKRRYFAEIAKIHDAAALKDYPESKRLVCVFSLIRTMQIRTRDQLGEMFLRRMGTIRKRAKDELAQLLVEQRSKFENVVITLGDVIEVIQREADDRAAGSEIRKMFSKKPIAAMQQFVEEVKTYQDSNYLPLLWKHYCGQRPILFRMLHLLELETTAGDKALMAAVDILRDSQKMKRAWLGNDIDLSFAPPRWRELTLQETGNGIKEVNRQLFEVCVFMHIADSLRSGDMAINGSEEFEDYRKHLLPMDECEKLIPEHCKKIGVPATAKAFVESLQKQLIKEAKKLDDKFPEKSDDVILDDSGRPVVRRGEARPIPESALRLREQITSLMPQRHVIECLENVEHWINFTRHFRPISGNDPKLKDAASRYLMTVFAMGCNLGPSQAARHFRGRGRDVTAHMLSIVNRRHMSLEMLEEAQRELNEVYLKLWLPQRWGDGSTVAADGTQYDFFDDNLLAGFHFRYRKTGAVAYRHVADNYIAVFRHFIGPGIWEAVWVIEALMNSGLTVEPDTVHSDTQGQSAAVFTFAHLFGVNLMPRIRNWKDLRLLRPSAKTRYEHIDKLFTEVADWKLIEESWDDLMQVTMSIVTGRISSARLLRKLGSYSKRNRLYYAAKALGEVIRTIYLLKWIGSRELRQEVTANTNKMESYNGFAKWVMFGGDVIANNDPDEQQKRLRYNDLVASTLILQNAVDMTEAIEKLRSRQKVSDEDLSFLSPYLVEHIMRFGKYRFRLNRKQEPRIRLSAYQAVLSSAQHAQRQKRRKVRKPD